LIILFSHHLTRRSNVLVVVNKSTELIDAAKAGSAVDESSVSAIPASTVIEPLEGASSAEVRVFSPVDDEGVVVESLAAENAVGLSTLSAFVEQNREIIQENLRLNDCELDMEVESTFKTPIKRRKSRNDKNSKQVKKSEAAEDASDDDDDSDSNVSVCSEVSVCSQNEAGNVLYKADDISVFLQETKGLKGVQIEDYFPNRAQFVKDTRYLIKEGAFSDLHGLNL